MPALLARALDTELPLIRRDGGFVRAGHSAELDELRQLRDESRQVIARMQAQYCDETGVKALKIRHNNVLGYFIEITANHSPALAAVPGRFIHRQTLANVMRYTTAELAEIETKIANAAGRALEIELAVFDALQAECVASAAAISEAAEALAVLDVSAALAHLADEEDWRQPVVDDGLAFRIEAGRHPVVERALRQAGGNFVANDSDIGASGELRPWPDLADHRAQHGRQVDLPAPERADRDPCAGGLLRAGEVGAYRRRRPAIQPGRRCRRPCARAFDLHGGDGRDSGDPQPGERAQPGHPRRDRARHGDVRRAVDRLGDDRASA